MLCFISQIGGIISRYDLSNSNSISWRSTWLQVYTLDEIMASVLIIANHTNFLSNLLSNTTLCWKWLFSCDNQMASIDPRDATRSILGGLLQTIWAVAPTYPLLFIYYYYYYYYYYSYSHHYHPWPISTHQRWSSTHSKVIENYLFSIANTPFGPFSRSLQLSFSQYDASVKHMLYAQIHTILNEVNSLFTHFKVIYISI